MDAHLCFCSFRWLEMGRRHHGVVTSLFSDVPLSFCPFLLHSPFPGLSRMGFTVFNYVSPASPSHAACCRSLCCRSTLQE